MRVKAKRVSEYYSVLTIGVVVGLISHANTQRWQHLGRDAYMAHFSQLFDKRMAHPTHLMSAIIASTMFALIAFVFFKGLAFVYCKLISCLPGSEAVQARRVTQEASAFDVVSAAKK